MKSLTPIQKEIITALKDGMNADENEISHIALFESVRMNVK